MVKRNTKVMEDHGQEVGVGERGRTQDRPDFGHVMENVSSIIDGFVGHQKIKDFQGLIIEVVSGVRFG